MDSSDYIATVAVVISLFALFWNLFTTFFLRPRLRVRSSFYKLIDQSGRVLFDENKALGPFFCISALNLGPGKIICSGIYASLKKTDNFSALVPLTDNLFDRFPKTLETGECARFALKIEWLGDASAPIETIYLKDSFDRNHQIPKRFVKKLLSEFERTKRAT